MLEEPLTAFGEAEGARKHRVVSTEGWGDRANLSFQMLLERQTRTIWEAVIFRGTGF